MESRNWIFLNCGLANIVFKYIGTNIEFKNKILRVRGFPRDKPNIDIPKTTEIYKYINDKISPFFQNDEIVDMQVVNITTQFLIDLDSKLPNDCKLSIKTSESNAILMPNIFNFYTGLDHSDFHTLKLTKHFIFHIAPQGNIIFEFKPKWLYTPPDHHVYCRNCALIIQRGEDHIACNLNLLSQEGIKDWCKKIMKSLAKINDPEIDYLSLPKLFEKTLNNNLNAFKTLYKLQNVSDDYDIHSEIRGLESKEDADEDLLLSMTIKDVSIFVILNTQNDTGILKIIDLDKKSNTKAMKWKKQELELSEIYDKKFDHVPKCL
ncbi:hypothetical protein B5S28_g2174 [[Candida] boidinii]|nr:hypothetical protein B5S28_g2174 [[Candida] boidinii]OWB63048.1 hypothetical protein B5S29_g4002 [[Candida] boidinii]